MLTDNYTGDSADQLVNCTDQSVNRKGTNVRERFGVSAIVGFAALALAGCGAPNTYVEPPPPEVTVTTPVERKVIDYLEFTGMTQPVETVEIRARVKGFLKERHFEDGAYVTAGQLLLVIDEEPYQVLLESAETKLKEARAAERQATESKSREVARAKMALSESQLMLAKQEELRIKQLAERKVVTQADLDQAIANRKTREAEVESAKANLDQELAVYDTAVLAAEAQVASAQSAVRSARLDLSYCRMSAPIDGRISRINVDIGNLVGANESSVLATIVKMDPLYVYATVSESDVLRTPLLTRLKGREPGESPIPIELGLAHREDYPHAGVFDYADPMLDATSGTLRVRARFENDDRSLMPGMFVRLRVAVDERPKALLVPERALGTDQSGQYILTVGKDNVVQYQPVKVGAPIDNLRVVEGKLNLGDRVIVEGLLRARPGAKVTPKADGGKAAASTATSHANPS